MSMMRSYVSEIDVFILYNNDKYYENKELLCNIY